MTLLEICNLIIILILKRHIDDTFEHLANALAVTISIQAHGKWLFAIVWAFEIVL